MTQTPRPDLEALAAEVTWMNAKADRAEKGEWVELADVKRVCRIADAVPALIAYIRELERARPTRLDKATAWIARAEREATDE